VAALEGYTRDVYPYFDAPQACAEASLREESGDDGTRRHSFRVFLPPGYAENTLQRYPVAYMQDGQNLFFRGEAFQGRTWRVRETVALLTEMNQAAEMIVVGIQPRDRMADYTKPGYEEYGRFLVEELKPRVDAEFRTQKEAAATAVMGSSLGGVVSLYLAWQHAGTFGMAACLSSTFGHADDLRERIADEPRRDLRLYLDSGYPRDNFEVTKQMVALLVDRGYRLGEDLLYLAFPEARHDESAWATRLHVPFQFLFGASRQLQQAARAAAAAAAPAKRTRSRGAR
jgi:predicted alpha/beta superfamily hydrolase